MPIFALLQTTPTLTLVAKQIGINASLMRQYISGNKKTNKKRIEEIQEGIRLIGRQLSGISLTRY